MDICHIQLASTPRIGFAHRFDTAHYTMHNGGMAGEIEIWYILSGDITVENLVTGHVFSVPAGSVVCLLYQNNRYYCHSDRFHRHVTAGIMAQHTIVEEGGLTLPLYMTFGDGEPDSEDGARIRDYLEALARDYCLQPTEDEKCAHALALLGMVSEIYLRRRTEDGTFGSEWYVNHAKQYVVEHIAGQIRVPDVAAHLEISPGYLSHMFAETTGMTLAAYINTVRTERLETLVVHYGMPLREAVTQVGIQDPNYASRLFKTIRGYTLSDAKRLRTATVELRQVHERAERVRTVAYYRRQRQKQT